MPDLKNSPAFHWLLGLAVALAIALGASAAEARAFLSRCAGETTAETIAVTSERPMSGDCTTIMLPIDASEVLAVVPAPRRRVDAPEPETMLVTGRGDKGSFSIEEISISPSTATPPTPFLMVDTDLRATAPPHLLDPNGRAKLATDGDQTLLDCAPGAERAGFALGAVRVPPIPGMSLRVVHAAEHTFRLAAAPLGNGDEPRLIAKLKTAGTATEAQVPLPTELPADTPVEFSVLCPIEGGRLALSELVLQAKTAVPSDRAAWARDPALWMKDPAKLFARAQHWGITRLYTEMPVGEHGLADPQAVARFIAAASERGIAVWAMLIDDGDAERLARAATAFADYNAGMPSEAQIKGVIVERAPERLWIYMPDPGAEAQRSLDRLQRLKPLLGMPLAAAVPSWFPTDASVADRMSAILDSLTVISNRTDPTEIRRSVARFLAWGARHARRVEVALEAMPIADAERRSFRRDAEGEAWLMPLGSGDVIVLLGGAHDGLPGRAFRQTATIAVPAASRSFALDHAALREGLDPLGRTLGTWPSFAGFAFHGLLRDRP